MTDALDDAPDEPVEPGRSERRTQFRAQITAAGKRTAAQNVADDRMVKRKRDSLKRRFGNPTQRRAAFVAWVAEINAKRGVI
jgi:hypothetical protein